MSETAGGRPWVIGVDLDNTLVIYDELFRTLARERGLTAAANTSGKRELRDVLRKEPEGEITWQKLQAAAYGPRIGGACLAVGIADFLRHCRQLHVPVFVISHKTEYAGYDETGTNLRDSALNWMAEQGLLASEQYGLSRESVYFGATRQAKIDHITKLGCTHFIDDLEETFLEETFPSEVTKVLYSPVTPARTPVNVWVAKSWNEISEHIFGIPT